MHCNCSNLKKSYIKVNKVILLEKRNLN